MSDRHDHPTPEHDWANPADSHHNDSSDIYGDTSTDLPPVEDAPYVTDAEQSADQPDTSATNTEPATTSAPATYELPDTQPVQQADHAEVTPTDLPDTSTQNDWEQPSPTPTPAEDDNDYQIEPRPEDPQSVHQPAPVTPATDNTPSSYTDSTGGVPRRSHGEEQWMEETAADTIPEVESTVVTRRSLLSAAQSTIPGGGAATVTPAPSSVAETPTQPHGSAAATPVATDPSAAGATPSRQSIGVSAHTADTATKTDAETRAMPVTPPVAASAPTGVAAGTVATADELFRDASAPVTMPGRFGAHAWTFLLSLLVLPVAWYLISDGIAHLALSGNQPWKTGTVDLIGILELGGGVLLAGLLLLSARWSTVGVFFSSMVLTVVGIPFLVAPHWTYELLQPMSDALTNWNHFGAAIAHHLLWTGFHGLLAIAGVLGLFVWLGTRGARKVGARREALRITIEERNARLGTAPTN